MPLFVIGVFRLDTLDYPVGKHIVHIVAVEVVTAGIAF